MKEIQLSNRGLTTFVDDKDYAELSQYKWYWRTAGKFKQGYAFRYVREGGSRRYVHMHRYILKAPIHMLVNHINGNGLDNQRNNLRLATHSQNLQSQWPRTGTKSGYKGVNRVKSGWQAVVQREGKRLSLGTYKTPQEAARAYNVGAIRYFGEFACLNEGV